jgi:hypothetical protein
LNQKNHRLIVTARNDSLQFRVLWRLHSSSDWRVLRSIQFRRPRRNDTATYYKQNIIWRTTIWRTTNGPLINVLQSGVLVWRNTFWRNTNGPVYYNPAYYKRPTINVLHSGAPHSGALHSGVLQTAHNKRTTIWRTTLRLSDKIGAPAAHTIIRTYQDAYTYLERIGNKGIETSARLTPCSK